MTYASLLSEEGINSQYLAVIKPRRLVTSWTFIGGTLYSASFDYGQVIGVDDDGVATTEATTSAVSDGDWFWDFQTETLYVDVGSDPALSNIVVTYEIHVGTFDAHFYRVPTDDTTRVVYFEPLIVQSPNITSSSADYLFGFMPTFSTSIVLSNLTHIFEKHIYDSSFNGADIDLYHYLDDLVVDNVKLALKGVCGDVSLSNSQVSISVLDRNQVFLEEYRNNSGGADFYTTGVFANLDPAFVNRPVRKVFGVVDGFVPVNIDYNDAAPSTSNNRTWVCTSDETNLGSISSVVPASPACTVTRTYLTSANGFRVGDTVWIDSASGSGSDRYAIVTVVNKTGDHYIEHATTGLLAAVGSVIKRSFVGKVTVFNSGKAFELLYGRDYAEYTDGTNKVAGFTLTSNFEANHAGISSPLRPSDVVYCRVYGNKSTATLGGSPFGSNSANTANACQAVVVLYDLLVNHLGLSEDALDTATFTSLQGTIADEIGLAIPEGSRDNFPAYKDLIERITTTILVKIFQNEDNEWSLAETAPAGSASLTIADDEILRGSTSYSFSYQDIVSKVLVEYAAREVSTKHQAGSLSYSSESASSDTAEYLHKISKQRTFKSLHFSSAEAADLASRLRYALGDRRGLLKLSTKNRFFNTALADVLTVSRDSQPGFTYVQETLRDRDFVVQSTEKSLRQITIELDDQKGIEENSGSW